MKARLHRFILVMAAAMLAAAALPDACLAAKEPADEVKMGKEAAAELEKQYKVLKDEALQARVDKIGTELATIANELQVAALYGSDKVTKFEYSFKILDDKDVNALSMPGGFIYINKGLVDYAQSDDELAGVVAHEIAHIAHHHMMALVKEQAKMNNQLAIALLATIIAGAPTADIGNVMMGARFIQIAKLNGYSRVAEQDADAMGLAILTKSKYNPVGMLTFMERLARDELNRPAIDWGVYQTHPYPGDRSREIASRLKQMGIEIDRRAVTKAAAAEVRPSKTEGLSEVWLGGKLMFAPSSGAQSSEERAKAVAERLNALLDAGLRLRDVRLSQDPPAVIARGESLIEVSAEDAALAAGKPASQVARDAYDVLYRMLFEQDMQKIF